MTFKELAEQYLKEFPRGIWVHFNDDSDSNERYLDGDYMSEFSLVLDKEVEGYYFDECDYEILEVFLSDQDGAYTDEFKPFGVEVTE